MLNSAGYQAHTKHIGITGNKKADAAAKALTVNKLLTPNFLLRTSILALVNVVVLNGKFLWTPLDRRDSSIMNRVQLGHTRLTHSHILSGEPPPIYSVRQTPLTVQHFMLGLSTIYCQETKIFYCLIT